MSVFTKQGKVRLRHVDGTDFRNGTWVCTKVCQFFGRKEWEEQFSLVSAFAGASVEISVGHCILAEDRDASSATSCVEKCVCE